MQDYNQFKKLEETTTQAFLDSDFDDLNIESQGNKKHGRIVLYRTGYRAYVKLTWQPEGKIEVTHFEGAKLPQKVAQIIENCQLPRTLVRGS